MHGRTSNKRSNPSGALYIRQPSQAWLTMSCAQPPPSLPSLTLLGSGTTNQTGRWGSPIQWGSHDSIWGENDPGTREGSPSPLAQSVAISLLVKFLSTLQCLYWSLSSLILLMIFHLVPRQMLYWCPGKLNLPSLTSSIPSFYWFSCSCVVKTGMENFMSLY